MQCGVLPLTEKFCIPLTGRTKINYAIRIAQYIDLVKRVTQYIEFDFFKKFCRRIFISPSFFSVWVKSGQYRWLHTPFCTLINLQHDSGVIQEQGIVCDDHRACPLLNYRIAVACKYTAEYRRRKWPETPCNNINNFFANCS